MNEKNTINIDGVEYVRKDNNEMKIHIVVLQRGYVFIGRLSKYGNDCTLYSASGIRRWGTKNGLGELANEGKKPETILDKSYRPIHFDSLTVVFALECDEEIWAKEL